MTTNIQNHPPFPSQIDQIIKFLNNLRELIRRKIILNIIFLFFLIFSSLRSHKTDQIFLFLTFLIIIIIISILFILNHEIIIVDVCGL